MINTESNEIRSFFPLMATIEVHSSYERDSKYLTKFPRIFLGLRKKLCYLCETFLRRALLSNSAFPVKNVSQEAKRIEARTKAKRNSNAFLPYAHALAQPTGRTL